MVGQGNLEISKFPDRPQNSAADSRKEKDDFSREMGLAFLLSHWGLLGWGNRFFLLQHGLTLTHTDPVGEKLAHHQR